MTSTPLGLLHPPGRVWTRFLFARHANKPEVFADVVERNADIGGPPAQKGEEKAERPTGVHHIDERRATPLEVSRGHADVGEVRAQVLEGEGVMPQRRVKIAVKETGPTLASLPLGCEECFAFFGERAL
mgnify:CR=1 FL=1